jgi:Protein of unknown function (DUF1186)/SEC-C motif
MPVRLLAPGSYPWSHFPERPAPGVLADFPSTQVRFRVGNERHREHSIQISRAYGIRVIARRLVGRGITSVQDQFWEWQGVHNLIMSKHSAYEYQTIDNLSGNSEDAVPKSDIMGIEEILREIERSTGRFARAAVEAAVVRQEAITPALLRILETTVKRAREIDAERDYMAHIYAMFLLAQFREPRAYPLLVQFASLEGDLLYSLCGQFITESLGRVLASVSGGDTSGIRSVIENEHADEWARGAALDGFTTLVAEGQLSRGDAIHYFADLFRTKLERRPSEVWNSLVASSCDVYPVELIKDIKRAYREGLVDPGNIGIEDVKSDLALGESQVLARLGANPHHRMVRSTIDEMGWWACFQHDGDEARLTHETFASNRIEPGSIAAVSDRRTIPKIGRNQSCPCGSGKKYKKCCLGK